MTRLRLVLGIMLALGTLLAIAPHASADSFIPSPAYKLCIGADATYCDGAYWEDDNLYDWCFGIYNKPAGECTGVETRGPL